MIMNEMRRLVKSCPFCGKSDSLPWGEPVRGFKSCMCSKCGLVYVKNPLNEKAQKAYYSDYISSVHQKDAILKL